MAIAHDASTDLGSGTGDLSATHTRGSAVGGTGAVVRVVQNTNATDQVDGVTYGGVPMVEVLGSPFLHPTGSEDGAIYIYFLADPPAGAQTVLVDTNSTGSSRTARVDTVVSDVAGSKIAIEDIAWLDQSSGANPALVMNTGTSVGTLTYAALHSGQDAVGSIAAGANMTEQAEHDFGSQTASFIRSTAVDSGGGFTAGWTVASEEHGAAAVALREVIPSGLSLRDELMADSPNVALMLDETSGTAAVDEVGGASGVYSGGVTFGQAIGIPNDASTGVAFDGVDDKVQIAHRSEFNVGDTLSIHVRFKLDTLGVYHCLYDKGANGPIIRTDLADNKILFRRNNVADIVKSTVAVVAGRWYDLWITKTGATVTMELDGVDVLGTVTNQTLTNTSIAAGLAAADAGTTNFLGGIEHAFALYPNVVARDRRQAITHAAMFGPSAADQDGDLEQAQETDSAGSLTPAPGAVGVGLEQAQEVDTAGEITPDLEAPSGELEQASETDSAGEATPAPGPIDGDLQQAGESDAAGDLTPDASADIPFEQATESDAAAVFSPTPGAVDIDNEQATETDSGGTLTPAPAATGATLGEAGETDAAGTLTPVQPPGVETEAASLLNPRNAKLHGVVNPNGPATLVAFLYGPTTSYGSVVFAGQNPLAAGDDPVDISAVISGLTPGATYHFVAVARHASPLGPIIYGEDQTFTTPEFIPAAAVTGEPVDDRLYVIAEHANGSISRWAEDDPDADGIPQDLEIHDTSPGGFADASFTLLRDPRRDWPDLALVDKITVHGRTKPLGRSAFEGQQEHFPSALGDDMSISVNAIGRRVKLVAKPYRELIVDQDMSRWGDPPLWRKKEMADLGFDQQKIQVGLVAGGLVFDVPAELLHNGWRGQAWQEMPAGVKVGKLGYRGSRTSAFAVFNVPALRSTDSNAAPTVISDAQNLTLDDTPRVATIGTPCRRVYLQVFASGDVTPAVGTQERYNALALYGTHGLTLRDIAGALPGVYGHDALAHIVGAAGLNYTTGPNGTIRDNTSFVIDQLAWLDAGFKRLQAVEEINAWFQWRWEVWEDDTFWWQPWDSTAPWIARIQGGAHWTPAGRQATSLVNGVVVAYETPDGQSRTVGPPGSGCDFESALLVDTSPTNELNRHGEERWEELAVGHPLLDHAAVQIGYVWMDDQKRPQRSGDLTIRPLGDGHVPQLEHPTIGPVPVWACRSGDMIDLVDFPDPQPWKIVDKSYSHANKTLRLKLDTVTNSLTGLFARLDVRARNRR